MNPRLRRILAILAASSALVLTGCEGGDSIPDAPAEDAGAGDAGADGFGEQDQPAPGLNPALPDTGDDLESPTPDDGTAPGDG